MTFDESLLALKETLELQTHIVKDLLQSVDELNEASKRHDKVLDRLENLIQPLMHIALDHEATLRKIEGEKPLEES